MGPFSDPTATRIAAWEARGERIRLPDVEVWAAVLGGHRHETTEGGADRGSARAQDVPVLVLHGFPTCSYDARQVVDALPGRRFLLLDMPGYGLSGKPVGYGYSLFEQADVVEQVTLRLLSRGGDEGGARPRVHVWAHDMGTSVTTELLARRERGALPFDLASVTLSNGSAVIELASLTVSQKFLLHPRFGPVLARLGSKRVFAAQLRRITAKPLPDAEIDDAWALIRREDGHLRLPQTIEYVRERRRFRERWLGAWSRSDVPAMVAWGLRDTVAVPAIADELSRLAPRARRVDWPELGHYPQLEDPPQVASTLEAFWQEAEEGRGR